MEAKLIMRSHSAAVQRIMESNAEYSRRVEGAAPAPTAADEVLSALPPDTDASQKVDLGLFWVKLGYEPTGEAVPYVSGGVESTARIWTRPVVPAGRRVIHTDFEWGFLTAEVVSFGDLVAAGLKVEAMATAGTLLLPQRTGG